MGKGFECQSIRENPPLLKGLSLDVTSSYKDQRNFLGEIPWTTVKILGIKIMRSLSQQHSCNLGAHKLMLGGKILHVWPLKALARNVYFQEVWFVHCLSLAYEEEIELNAHKWLSELQSNGTRHGCKWHEVSDSSQGGEWLAGARVSSLGWRGLWTWLCRQWETTHGQDIKLKSERDLTLGRGFWQQVEEREWRPGDQLGGFGNNPK